MQSQQQPSQVHASWLHPNAVPVLTISVPPTLPGGWAALPGNPALGFVVPKEYSDMNPEDYRFYCDSCQRGFTSAQQWQAHLDRHIYCTTPGCNFTCRREKAYKMEMHVELLHNRPDAPNLMDLEGYRRARTAKYPTRNRVATKVEELFFRSSRGEILPEEWRHWLRGHGVAIPRHPPRVRPGDKRPRQQREDHLPSSAPPQQSAPPPPPRRPKIIPMGPNNTLTPAQRVQLIRERYADAVHVPGFYVCHRCGQKGDHWVEDCPKKEDPAFDRRLHWAEPKMGASHSHPPPASAEDNPTSFPLQTPSSSAGATATAVSTMQPPMERDAREPPTDPPPPPPPPTAGGNHPDSRQDVPTTMRPSFTSRGRGGANVSFQRRAPQYDRRPPPPPTLYDKLVEDEKLNERGLMLQAIRYFVQTTFLSGDE